MTLTELIADWKQRRAGDPTTPAGVAVTKAQWNALLDRLPAVPQPGTFGINPTLTGLPVVVAEPWQDIPVGYVRLSDLLPPSPLQAEGTPNQ